MDLHKAYEILGVPETASNEEIEEKYFLWIRKFKSIKSAQSQEGFDFDRINEAYKIIKSHLEALESLGKKQRSPFAEKTEHFFMYYKLHVIGAILVLLLAGYIVNTIIEKRQEAEYLASLPPENVTIMLYGSYYVADDERINELQDYIVDNMPGWERVTVNVTYLPSDDRNPQAAALYQKAMINLMTDESDIYIVDETSFDNLVQQGLFIPLEDYNTQLSGIDPGNLRYAVSEEYEGEHLFGVEFQNKSMLLDRTTIEETSIIGLRFKKESNFDPDRRENALKLIRALAEDFSSNE